MWSEVEYTACEEDTVEVCAQLVGSLNTDIEVHLSTMDYTAVGKKRNHC